MDGSEVQTGTIRTSIPARLDRLPWTRFHWLIVAGLGTAWILEGEKHPSTPAAPGAAWERGCRLTD
jgi:hypothetical protein